MSTIVQLNDYNEFTHVGYIKFAQIQSREFPLGKKHAIAHWIAYADSIPNFGEDITIVDITGNPDVKEGWLYMGDGTFTPPDVGVPALYTNEEKVILTARTRLPILSFTDVLVIRHRDQVELGIPTTLTAEQYAELLTYRQALRDFPETVDLNDIKLPELPSFMRPPVPQE